MTSISEFEAQFSFNPINAGLVGVERETFLVRNGRPDPIAHQVLFLLPNRNRYGYELSACQLEDRVGPVDLSSLHGELHQNDMEIAAAAKELGFERSQYEVATDDMPLDIYPDPTGRYQSITKNMPRNTLLSACQVIGTHVHVGMPDCETAISVYNKVIPKLEELCRMGDGSCGRRLSIYKTMAPDFEPPHYDSWEHFHQTAIEKSFDLDPRKCWHLIRISKHGTIEFRMFGTTSELPRILTWATRCYELCQTP